MITAEKFIQDDIFARHCGIELLELAPGKAAGRMKIRKEHMNGMGIVHGGAIFSLADLVFAAASNSHQSLAMAINVSISYVKKVTGGTLTAKAEEISVNPRLGTYTVRITDEAGDTVAIFQGMVYRKKPKMDTL
ncbi:MAG: PaaI family thioesterase [Desulfococcaceae bacterium]|jgi:acyl-CoA thioesterase|nr:PaaI family thioesterase [Desulfococcaceae bacterium]